VSTELLAVPIYRKWFCDTCCIETEFIAYEDCDLGLLARCSICNEPKTEPKLLPFSRTISEVVRVA